MALINPRIINETRAIEEMLRLLNDAEAPVTEKKQALIKALEEYKLEQDLRNMHIIR